MSIAKSNLILVECSKCNWWSIFVDAELAKTYSDNHEYEACIGMKIGTKKLPIETEPLEGYSWL